MCMWRFLARSFDETIASIPLSHLPHFPKNHKSFCKILFFRITPSKKLFHYRRLDLLSKLDNKGGIPQINTENTYIFNISSGSILNILHFSYINPQKNEVFFKCFSSTIRISQASIEMNKSSNGFTLDLCPLVELTDVIMRNGNGKNIRTRSTMIYEKFNYFFYEISIMSRHEIQIMPKLMDMPF